MTEFSPREIVSELDRFIVGQAEAKRAVAVALRNRWRRRRAARRPARRGDAQEHPDDRPHRRRQDRDRPAAGPAGPGALPEGRGHQVHRGRLRRPRRRPDHARPGRGGHRPGARAPPRRACGPAPRPRPRSGILDALVGPGVRPGHPRQLPQEAARRRAGRQGDRARRWPTPAARHAGASTSPASRRRWAC